MRVTFFLLLFPLSFFSACIGDDIVEDAIPERISINNIIDSLQINATYTLDATFFNNVGQVTLTNIDWLSTNESVATIDPNGTVRGLSAGSTNIVASVALANNSRVEDQFELIVSEAPVEEPAVEVPEERSGTAQTTSFYTLEGDFVLRQEAENLLIEFADNYEASDGLPGFYLYLTNNPNTINNALEVARIDILEGAHTYLVPNVDIQTYNYLLFYCKPFGVKVGDGEIE